MGSRCAQTRKNAGVLDLRMARRKAPVAPFSRALCVFSTLFTEGSMIIKIAIHEASRVTYMMVAEDELDTIVARYPDAEIFVLNILG